MQIPSQANLKVKKVNKYLLRKVLEKYLPPELILNQKRGFSLPLGYWMRNRLKKWSYSSIFEENNFSKNNLNIEILSKIWNDHQASKIDRSKILWNVIILNNWIKEWSI